MQKKIEFTISDLKWTIERAIETGKILKKFQQNLSSLKVSAKKAQGVVSIADKTAEKYLIKKIQKRFPSHEILAEENYFELYQNSSTEMKKFQSKEYCWVIDPLDGTTNFLNGLDYFAVCIGLLYRGEPVMGVVYRPRTGECFYSLKGKGAFYCQNMNGKAGKLMARKQQILVKKNLKALKDGLVVTGFSGEKGTSYEEEFKLFRKVARKVRGIRRFGSAALDLCYVGLGQFDGFWERGLAPWDVTAAGVFCQEAGVLISAIESRDTKFNPFADSFVAARPTFFNRFKKVLS
jgi:myo-inositol-1(or 4)-monophosphatase